MLRTYVSHETTVKAYGVEDMTHAGGPMTKVLETRLMMTLAAAGVLPTC